MSGIAPREARRSRIVDVPEYLAPGVYVEETSYRSKAIEGVPTSSGGFAALVLGIFLGVVVAIAVDKARRRSHKGPPDGER